MSYFAKPKFIIYDEWFDDDLEKTKLNFDNKKTKTFSNTHDFFYEKSNYFIGGSENNMQIDIKVNKKGLIISNDNLNIPKSYSSSFDKKSWPFKKFNNVKLKLNPTKNLLFSFSIFSLSLIFGLVIFLISQNKQNESNISTNFYNLEKKFDYLK